MKAGRSFVDWSFRVVRSSRRCSNVGYLAERESYRAPDGGFRPLLISPAGSAFPLVSKTKALGASGTAEDSVFFYVCFVSSPVCVCALSCGPTLQFLSIRQSESQEGYQTPSSIYLVSHVSVNRVTMWYMLERTYRPIENEHCPYLFQL